ncbi:DUF6273 domain-containing protein [Paenibacillus sp. SC116]|uniref:DUF6273 domain-containing protein n=1 Tax=Paenibacillus sp. SC116 TaxID=2968986 RepID=UPI00215A4D1C|nr:DUF6273 domain-containing protein [Paenibacillus sp. SC116]MCR8845078.1 DUF6273 domain-containing protein [Paenibacillus sp. SC116]
MEHDNLVFTTLRSAQPGELITFGTYPQTADGADRAPIKWRVLQHTDGELFLLSEYILDSKRYYRENADITWRDSDVRTWLNDEFYNAAFNDTEKRLIKTTHCTDNGEDSADTEDKVFLLSVAEAQELTDKLGAAPLRAQRGATGTEFAKIKKSDGCNLYVYDKSVKDNYIIEDGEELGCSWWWLRTQTSHSSRAYFVGTRSSIRSYGNVNLACYGVRPSLKINLP